MPFFICSNCGYGSASWIGRCPDCQEWNTLKENFDEKQPGRAKPRQVFEAIPLSKIRSLDTDRRKTGIFEFDRVLGGGFVHGEAILLAGEPGIGKSTLVLQALHRMKTVYVSGEEAASQIKTRAKRIGVNTDAILFSETLETEAIVQGVEKLKTKPDLIVIDSIQTVYSNTVEAPQGNVSQLKETTSQLIALAKRTATPIVIIGHVTKEGEIAGPKTLEHLVDCVLNFEGEKLSTYRLLRSSKNRFGPTDEIGIFEMKEKGLVEVDNPLVFLEHEHQEVVGKAIVGISEGKRPLFFEIQTLVVPTSLTIPRRVVKGLDYNKVLLLLAVARKYLGLSLDAFDVYVNVVGGVAIKSPAADLGLVASLLSSLKNIPLKKHSLFIGEVGLLGETRKVLAEEKIISEGKRLGFTYIISSSTIKNIKDSRLFL